MDALKRIIQNETESLMRIPVINQNVSRFSMIKDIEPKVLIDYAMNNNLATPKLDCVNKLETYIELNDNTRIHLSSKKVKVETTYSY